MNPKQLSLLKNEIVEELHQVKALKLSMKRTLAKLSRWEKRLRADTARRAKTAARKRAVVDAPERKTGQHAKPADLTPGERVEKALQSICSGTFTRAELLVEAEGYGRDTIAVGTYSRIFRDLVRTGRIECVEGRPSGRDSRYARTERGESCGGPVDHLQDIFVPEASYRKPCVEWQMGEANCPGSDDGGKESDPFSVPSQNL